MNDRMRLEFEGTVTDDTNGKFRVQINDNHTALCTLSGKIRQNAIRILVGDTVRIEVSEYDTNQGRITRRIKQVQWLDLNIHQSVVVDLFRQHSAQAFEQLVDFYWKALLPHNYKREVSMDLHLKLTPSFLGLA